MLARGVRNRGALQHAAFVWLRTPAARELRFGVLQSFATLRFSAIRYLQRRLFVTDTTDTDMHGVTAVVTAAGVGTAVAWFSRPHHPGTQLHELLP